VEVFDDRQVVKIVGLCVGAVILADREGHSLDGDFAIDEPSKFAAMS
jgi:hypothetical protein